MTGPTRTERVQLSPTDRAARIERCARAMKRGVTHEVLRERFSSKEIEAAAKQVRKP